MPMGSRAAMIRGGETDSSRRTKENMPSSLSHRALSCSRYCSAFTVSYLRGNESSVDETYEGNDNFAIRVGLEGIGILQAVPKFCVVVDLAVDGQNNLSIVTHEGLSTRVCESGKL